MSSGWRWGRGFARAENQSFIETLESRVLLSAVASDTLVEAGLTVAADVELPSIYYPRQVFLAKRGGYLSAPATGTPVAIAMQYLQANAGYFGLKATDMASSIVTDQYTDTHSGVTHIYLRQVFNGLEIANANLGIHVSPHGRVISVGGAFIPGVGGKSSLVAPSIDAPKALEHAAQNLGIAIGQETRVVKAPVGISRKTELRASPVSADPIDAELHYVLMPDGKLKLAWNMALRTPDEQHWYNLSVAADSGTVVFAVDWVNDFAASYNVFPRPVESPQDGGRSIVVDPHEVLASPYGWHDMDGHPGADYSDTRGNNVFAQEDTDSSNAGGFRPSGAASGSNQLNFDFAMNLSQLPQTYQSASVTNLFYWNNLLHDIHYRYGFTEAAGNFQLNNYGKGGVGGDAVQADAQDGGGTNNANFATPPDGRAPRMQMYNFTYSPLARDSALQNEIIAHEYGHGVSIRLTGGPANSDSLNSTQSGGMGEGWSDFWGMMLTQKPTDTQSMAFPQSNYVMGQSASGVGIRRFAYSYDMSINPLTFDAFGTTGVGGGVTRSVQVHNTGEIWCSTLWDLNWLLINKHGYQQDVQNGYDPLNPSGNTLLLQLVMDGLKLQPANPTFTQARDAILQADQVLTGGENQREIWAAFARRGLGYSAYAGSSSDTANIIPAFDIPPVLLEPGVVLHSPRLTVGTPISSINIVFSEPMNTASFSLAADINSFVGPGSTDLLSQITGAAWSGDAKKLTIHFTPQSTNGLYAINLGPNILAGDDGHPLDQDRDGTGGEAGQDTYTATFRYDNLVGGVSATAPAHGSTATLPLGSIDISFAEPIDASSLANSDLVLSQGQVTGFSVIGPDTVRFEVGGITHEGTLGLSIAAGAISDAAGNPMEGYQGTFVVDFGSQAFPAPLEAQIAPGKRIYEGSTSGIIGHNSDSDWFTLDLDAGQTLSLLLHPSAGLRGQISLRDASNNLLGSASSIAMGSHAWIQSIPIAVAGIYSIEVSSFGSGSSGDYNLYATLNAAMAEESVGGSTNNTRATAQNLDGGFSSVAPGSSATMASVLDRTSGPLDVVVLAEDFESGVLGPAWSTYSSTADGRIRITDVLGTASGTGALAMDTVATNYAYTLNEAVWTVNLSAVVAPLLTFSMATASFLPDSLPMSFSGHANGDGVAISSDGINWDTIWTAHPEVWTSVTVDLASAAANSGITLGANFKIKFQHYGNAAIPDEGAAYDAISISAAAVESDYYSFTLSAGQSVSLAGTTNPDPRAAMALKLLDSAGLVLAQGSSTADAGAIISNFVAPADGIYYAHVSATAASEYGLTILRGGVFDREANDALWQAQPLSQGQVVAGSINGGTVIVEPDNYPAGTVLTNIVPGITLSAQGSTASVQSAAGEYASTGTRVFARGSNTSWRTSSTPLRADFVVGATSVSIDVVELGWGIPGVLSAFDSDGKLLEEAISLAPLRGESTTLTINRPAADIAYVLAGGWSDYAGLDRLVVTGPGSSDDYYVVSADSGERLTARTFTPGDGPGEFTNELDPRIDVYYVGGLPLASDDNSAADGRNAVLEFIAPIKATYFIRVSSVSGTTGDYSLLLTNNRVTTSIPVNISESAGTVMGTVNVSAAPNVLQSVMLTSSNPGRVSVPSTLLFFPGQTSVPLPLTLHDNGALDGPEAVVISVAMLGYANGASTITVLDDETAGLTLNLPAAAAEGDGTVQGSIVASAAPTRNVVIQLVSNNSDRVTFPSTVTLPAGQTTTTFNLNVIDNALIDGTESVTLTASAGNWTGDSAAIEISDNDAVINLVLPSSGWEGQSLSGEVVLGGPALTDLVVGLLASDGTELSVPTTVTILAGEQSATFTLTLPTDGLKDGNQSPTLTASAAGFASDQAGIVVHDADPDRVSFDSIISPRFTATPFPVTVRVRNMQNEVIWVFAGTGALTASGPLGAIPAIVGPLAFTGGVWTGDVQIDEVHPTVFLTATLATVIGSSSAFATAMGAPSTPSLAAASDSGVFNDDRITNLNNSAGKTLDFIVGGTVAGATVTILSGSTPIGTAIATGTSTVVTTNGTTVLANGNRSISARQSLNGATSNTSAALSVTIDTTAPTKPTLNLTTASDTGISRTDGITNNNTPAFYVGSYFRFYRDGIQISDDYQTGNEYYHEHYRLPAHADGTYIFSIEYVDLAGNVSIPTTKTVTIDTIAPAAPTAPDLRASDDSGLSDSDNITNVQNPTLDLVMPEPGVMHVVFDGIDRQRIVASPGGVSWVPSAAATFTSAANVPTGTSFRSLIVADMNNDGDLDLVSSTSLPFMLNVNLGNGDGTFQSAIIAPRADIVIGLAAGDFNGDGNMDLVLAEGSSSSLKVLLGDGTGSFYHQTPIDLGDAAQPNGVTAGDVNGDGNWDIVAAAELPGKLAVIYGNGDGTFAPAASYALAGSPKGSILADVNGDSRLDILLYRSSGSGIFTYLQNPDGTFQAPKSRGTLITPSGLAVGDFDHDGILDLMCTSSDAEFFKGIGDGTFLTGVAFEVGANATGSVAADFNLDGNLDYATSSSGGGPGYVNVLFGRGDGTFLPSMEFAGGVRTPELRGADFNHDGRIDFALKAFGEEAISILLAHGGTLSDGPHRGYAWVEDFAGNWSAHSPTLNVVIDTTAPAIPAAPDLRSTSDSGVSENDNVTKISTPVFDISGGSYYRLFRDQVQQSGDFQTSSTYLSPALVDGDYDFALSAVDVAGNVSAASAPLTVTIDTLAPSLLPQFNFLTAPQNLTYHFNEPVAGVGTGNFALNDASTAETVSLVVNYDAGSMAAILTWPTVNGSGILGNGNYVAEVLPGISDLAGNSLPTYSFEFFHLNADANRDRKVDVMDLVILATNWGGAGMNFLQGDFNYDGMVDAADLGILGTQWQRRLDPPAPPSQPMLSFASRTATRTPTRISDQVLRAD